MWKAIIQWIKSKSYRCKHDWELEERVKRFDSSNFSKRPDSILIVYRCTKCCNFNQKKIT